MYITVISLLKGSYIYIHRTYRYMCMVLADPSLLKEPHIHIYTVHT